MKKQTYIALLVLILLFITSCSKNVNQEEVQTAPVKKRTIVSSVIATGIVKPQTGSEVKVGSRISGIVVKLYVNIGDTVKKGDLLAKLEETELLAEYNQAIASLESANTVLRYAQIEKERQKELYSKNFTSKQNYDNSVKDYELAITNQKLAQANVDYAKVQLNYTNIIAPTDGVVASIATQEGETVAAMFAAPTFVTIIDLDRLEVRAYVDEIDISAISNGQKVQFTIDTYAGVEFTGVVKTIYPKAEVIDNVVNYIVIIEISNSFGKLLRPEMTTTVDIITDSISNALTVPNKAITKEDGDNVVYIYDGNEMIKKKVSIGRRGKLYTQIKSGISENDKVVLNSFNLINN